MKSIKLCKSFNYLTNRFSAVEFGTLSNDRIKLYAITLFMGSVVPKEITLDTFVITQ